MRLATIIPKVPAGAPIVAVSVGQEWISLDAFLRFLHVDVPTEVSGDGLEFFFPAILPRLAELTMAARDWGERADAFRAQGGAIFAADQFLAPILRPPSFRDFYAFEQHVKAARARRGLEMIPAWYEIPVFYFSNPNSLIGDNDAVFAPAGSEELDYELELGIIVGKGGRDIAVEAAWEHVAGFTIINDLSARDLQRVEMAVGLGPAKGKDFATAAGPVLVTRDEFDDRIDGETLALEMAARVNGRELSRGNSRTLFHSIPKLIAQASRDADLAPGDLLGTGTVGTGCILELGPETTGGWLQAGDAVELEIEGIGTLRTRVTGRPA